MTAGLAALPASEGSSSAAAATGETAGVNVLFVCVANSGGGPGSSTTRRSPGPMSPCPPAPRRSAPVITGVRRISWQLPDPTNLPLEDVREVRDDIDRRVTALAADLDAEQA